MTTIPLILYISRKWDEEWMRGRGGGVLRYSLPLLFIIMRQFE